VDWATVPSCAIAPADVPKYSLALGDIVFARTGATTGKSFLIRDCPSAVFASYLIRLRVTSAIRADYLYWFFQSADYWRQIAQHRRGIAQPGVNASSLANLAVPLPTLEEQLTIVAEIEKHFTRLDAAIESLKQAQTKLRAYYLSTLNAAFHNTLAGLKGRKPLPPSWRGATLSQVADVQLGRQRSPKNHIGPHMRPYIRAGNITWDGFDLSDVMSMNFEPSELETFRLEPGDILLSEASGSASEVGKPALWRGEIADCCFQNTVIRVRPHRGIHPNYLFWHLRADAASGRLAKAVRGVGIHHLGAQRASSWPVTVAPEIEQPSIVERIERLVSRRQALLSAVELNLKRVYVLRQTVLAAAFSGRLVQSGRRQERVVHA
jgi:type I restriction enzyme S subunit